MSNVATLRQPQGTIIVTQSGVSVCDTDGHTLLSYNGMTGTIMEPVPGDHRQMRSCGTCDSLALGPIARRSFGQGTLRLTKTGRNGEKHYTVLA